MAGMNMMRPGSSSQQMFQNNLATRMQGNPNAMGMIWIKNDNNIWEKEEERRIDT